MKTKYFILAAIVGMTFASCSNDEFIGDTSPTLGQESDGSIQFSYKVANTTRADIVGSGAAALLGNGFYVTGTKADMSLGTPVPTNSPTTKLVFDNYLVHYGVNTAGTTESNTANWEYVGVTPGTSPYEDWAKLAETATSQTIKYWDYSAAQYDFMAFSTGSKKAVKKTDLNESTVPTDDDVQDGEIGVTKMLFGGDLVSNPAYTFYIPTIDALKGAYITDIQTVEQGDYGKEVTLQFKSLGSKIRLALYETVPGYSIQAGSVKFYTVDKSDANVISSSDLNTGTSTTAALISSNTDYGFARKGTVVVSYPIIGTANKTTNSNYNKASVSVTPVEPATLTDAEKYQTFGTLSADKYATAEGSESAGALYLGRSLPQATFAGLTAKNYYQTVFPVSAGSLTLRVDYTLVSTDGSGETINVYGAKAVVPSTYTVWQPNYAYTYIFKISDNTNGWTTTAATVDNKGLYPITFDAVVAEIKDASGEQTTVTTVATPTITTYQQNHKYTTNEYSKTTKGKDNVVRDLYVQVMDNSASPATLKTDLNGTTPTDATNRSLLYAVTLASGAKVGISEATVMDALQNQHSVDGGTGAITGRNGVILTPDANITTTGSASKFDIVNGPDDKKITVNEGEAAKIAMSTIGVGTYAYVYDYTTAALGKNETNIYQPTSQKSGAIANGTKYITTASLGSTVTAENEAVVDGYLYFSKTTTDGVNYTYSFVSVDGKETLPAGLLKVGAGSLSTSDGSATADANTFVFDIYIRNDGKYAVKVIKVVE